MIKVTFLRYFLLTFYRIVTFEVLDGFFIILFAFSEQRGQLKRPDHADLRYKCRTYARLLQHLKVTIWMNYNSCSDFCFAYMYLLSDLLCFLC